MQHICLKKHWIRDISQHILRVYPWVAQLKTYRWKGLQCQNYLVTIAEAVSREYIPYLVIAMKIDQQWKHKRTFGNRMIESYRIETWELNFDPVLSLPNYSVVSGAVFDLLRN